MEPRSTKNGTLLRLPAAPAGRAPTESTIQRIDALPSWREVLEYRRTGQGGAAITAYAARHPGFAHVLSRLEREDDAERGEE
jgi:hypothetical protein